MTGRILRLRRLPLIFSLIACAADFAAHATDSQAPLSTGTRLDTRPQVAEFDLLDQRGRPFGRHDLLSSWSVLLFGYTECPDVCPTTLSTLATVERNLRASHKNPPRVIFASGDTVHDTPAKLARFVGQFDPTFVGVTSKSQKRIEDFARNIGATVVVHGNGADQYVVGHSGALFVVDRAGRVAAVLTGPFTVAKLQSDLQAIIAGS